LLEDTNVTAAHVIVAKDRSADYMMINEAMAAVPKKSEMRFVIHVKEGNYSEKCDLGQEQVECDDVWGWQDEDHHFNFLFV
jgi:pectin methylesterase-like acyl-CoA thioesterase